jgi:hypothetical protein
MTLLIFAGGFVVAIASIFFYRTVDMDLAGSIIAGVIASGLLGLVIEGAVYAGRLF